MGFFLGRGDFRVVEVGKEKWIGLEIYYGPANEGHFGWGQSCGATKGKPLSPGTLQGCQKVTEPMN